MSRFHPFRYLCLLVASLVGSWLLLALLFLFLPSIPYSWDNEPSDHIETGHAITRVYKVEEWLPWFNSKPTVQAFHDMHREFFAIDYQITYSPASSKSWFVLDTDRHLDLNYYWNRVDKTPRPPEEEPAYYLSEPVYIKAKLGDGDGINPPWFRHADACLLFWDIHQETILMPLRLKVLEYQIEVWPDSDNWDGHEKPSTWTEKPLLVLYNPDGYNGTRIQTMLPHDGDIEHTSPSRTFKLRRAIQSVLVPTGLFVYNHSGFVAIGLVAILEVLNIAFKLLAFYALVVFICWVANGKPQFGPWIQSYWMTRHIVVRLPTLNQDSSAWTSQPPSYEDSTSERRPQPLRGLGDFFRSSSPLDDLFVTFEYTKGMVEPITFRRTRADSGERAQVTGVPNDFEFNVAYRSAKHGSVNQQKQQSDIEKGPLPED